MAGENTAIGSALVIPDSLFAKLDKMDEKLKVIQQSSEKTASVMTTAFSSMQGGTMSLEGAFNRLVDAISKVNTAASSASAATSNMGVSLTSVGSSGMEKVAKDATTASMSITQATNQINQMYGAQVKNYEEWKKINSEVSSLESRQTELNATIGKYQLILNDIKNGKGGMITTSQQAGLKAAQEEYNLNQKNIVLLRQKQQQLVASNQELNKQVTTIHNLQNLNKGSLESDRSVAILKQMSQYYKELERSSAQEEKARQKAASQAEKQREKEAKAAEKAAEREERAIERVFIAEQRAREKQNKEKIEGYKASNYAKNTTVSGALEFAQSANTINRRTVAIQYLTAARAKLNTTDAQGKSQLEQLNAAIKRLNQENEQAVASSKKLSNAHQGLINTANQLKRSFTLLFSVSQIKQYISSIAETRGYFELQQRSLQAILSNKTKADEIYRETLKQALDSPFTARQLITFTKQLAAYRIETDKLFDTTKRLADVSAGLGVDMQRLILAYGQVKAAAYLRGTEVRQFTEAGINLYGELQSYFKEVKGEAYTTAQIVDMISKRKVTFEDIEQVFKRLTNEGGLFYNMQHIQVETLQGKLGKLRDAIEQMQNEVGKSNEGLFKGSIDVMTSLVMNYEVAAGTVKTLVGAFIGFKALTYIPQKINALSLALTEFKMKVELGSVASNKFIGTLRAMSGVLKGLASIGAGVGFMFLLDFLLTAWQRSKEWEKTVTQLNKDLASTRTRLNDLIYDFNKLEKASYKAQSTKNIEEYNKKIDEQRLKLEEIISVANSKGLNLKINVKDIKEEDLPWYAENISTLTDKFSASLTVAQIRSEDKGFLNMQYNFADISKDFDRAAAEFIAQADKIDDAIVKVKENYNLATSSTKEYFDAIREGRREGESTYDYYARMASYIKTLSHSKTIPVKFRVELQNATKEIFEDGAYKNLIEQIGYLKRSAFSIFNGLDDMKDKERFQQLVEQFLKTQDVSIETKKLVASFFNQKYGLKIKVETPKKEEIIKKTRDIQWIMQDYFDRHKIRVSFEMDSFDPSKALGEIESYGDKLKKYTELRKRIEKSKADVLTLAAAGITKRTSGRELGLDKDFVDASTKVSRETMLDTVLPNLIKNAKKLSDFWGLNPFEKEDKRAAKQQRDILSEQIDLVTALLNKYKELRKYKSAEESVDVLKSYYASSIQYTKIGSDIIDRILENGEVSPEKVAAVVDNIAKKFKEVTKRNNALQKAADIRANVVVDTDKKSLDESKKDIEDAFNALSMYRDLKKLGLNDVEIRNTFGELPKTFKDIQNIITATFTGKEGEEWIKQREESEKKLAENVQKYNLDMFKELTKDYKTQLEDQLQLDVWYAEERTKIMKNVNDPNLRKQYIENLDTKYQEKTDKNIWDAFSSSDAYIDLFDNLEYYSNTVLVHMKERLVEIRQQLGKLNPTEIKQILDAEQKLDEQLNKSQSWGNLAKNLKSYIKLRKQVSRDKGAETQARKDLANYTKQLDIQSKIVAQKKVAADDSTDATSKAWSEYAAAVSLYETTKKNKEEAEDTVKTYDKQRKSLAEMTKTLLANIQNLGKIKLGDGMEESVSGLTNSLSEFASMLEDSFGVYIGQDVKDILEGVGAFFGAIENFDITKPISSALNLLTGLGKSIGAIFGFGNKDDDLQKEIQKHQVLIERLQRAYDKLKESMDKAWSSDLILQNRRDLEKNIELQIKNYQAMIKAENDKKHTDVAKIQEWQDAIEDLQDSIKELEEEITQAFGGIGEKNYKSAAEAFTDAWLDAFNNTENSLEALNDTFDDYFNTILKKQILNRAAQRYLQPLFDAIDKAVSEGSAGGNMGTDVTAGELQGIQDLANIQLEGFNEYVSALMEALNIKPSSQNSLSALQQGIQNITESQASAIESILNSMRFFAAQTAEDVSAIRRLLTASRSLVQSDGEQSLLLGELKNQTSIMNKLYSLLDSVIKPTGHRYNGGGIKVFMN